jgi:tetratricopeptide (TPR) repeat protein
MSFTSIAMPRPSSGYFGELAPGGYIFEASVTPIVRHQGRHRLEVIWMAVGSIARHLIAAPAWQAHGIGFLLLAMAFVCPAADVPNAQFVGPEACARCHPVIAAQQTQTAMATTWQGPLTNWLPPGFQASVADDLPYELKRTPDAFAYSVEFGGSKLTLPVEILMGGRRHGLGFLASMSDLDGLPLARRTLVQARYEWSPEKKQLLLAPGCVLDKPKTLDTALGVVLTPTFEARCLSCHGQPNSAGSGQDGGVHCESCHGPGAGHLQGVSQGTPRRGIVNPKRLSVEASIDICAGCHIGLAKLSDPSPDDLLVANQVRALRSSECFLQSGKAISCATCHDPHNDAGNDDLSVRACLNCHATSAKPHAALCPVNAAGGCIGCHMPSVQMGPLHLVDHVIRVHPGQAGPAATPGGPLLTEIRPVSEYLRIIASNSREAAASARSRVQSGESFYKVASEVSVDQTAAIGGYLGRKTLADLDVGLADEAARLNYGQTSPVFESGGRWIILLRVPRDFRWQAERLERQAEELAARNEPVAAIGKAQEALMIYPHFLRALNLIGAILAASGNPKRAAQVLTTATRLYPNDAGTEFALGSALELLSDKTGAAKAYNRAISLEEDFTAAYGALGLISSSAGDWKNAITIFRRGLRINPLSPELNYDLGLALNRGGDSAGAQQAFALARRLDPTLTDPGLRNPAVRQPGEMVRPKGP